MKTLALRGGDLVVGPGGLVTVTGHERVRQDLGVAAREPLGSDRFHPRWGTTLPDMIGLANQPDTEALVRAEILRLVQNYVALQGERMSRDSSYRRQPRYDASEIIDRIDTIDVRQEMDRLHVRVVLHTLSGAEVTLIETVGA